MTRRICVVTGSRAEYGLLYWLMKEIRTDPDLELQVLVTGMHLSPEFGLTYREIESDGFTISRKVEMLLSSDTPVGIGKAIGLGVIGIAEAMQDLNPDILVLLGDRFETLAAAVAAAVSRVPIAHIHGGESTEGAMDEAFRHAITKMSHVHFTAAKVYGRRVIRMGEDPARVFVVGALGNDWLEKMPLLDRKDLERSLSFDLGERNLLVTFHPVTLEKGSSERQFQNLLDALEMFPEIRLIFTRPNADTEGRVLIPMIEAFVDKVGGRAASFTSLGRLRYLSALSCVDGVIGNSSSGLIEAPSLRTGTINIGDRQKGRLKATSVIDCDPETASIAGAIRYLYSPAFQARLDDVTNPYGESGAAGRITEVLKRVELADLLKKTFYEQADTP